jgi:NAD-dependent SIR2 family protein deacetylase
MINSVRNTVLSVLNKNNYGYISPSDFNLFAKQAQLEIFEEFFSEYNKIINMENARMSGTDYANLRKAVEEAVETFIVTSTLTQVTPASNRFFLPSVSTTGFDYFMINKILCYDASGPTRVFKGEAEKVTHSKITMLVNSNLTAPTELYPAYTQEGSSLTVYPATINLPNEVEANYFRYPKDPKWTYVTLANGEPVFNQSQLDYQDFEVPIEDEIKLVSKILQYAGMSIREIEAVQFGGNEEQKQSQ